MLDTSSTTAIILALIGVIVLIAAISNAYRVRSAIKSIKNKTNLNFVKFNILLSLIFVIGYFVFIGFVLLDISSGIEILSALLFILFSLFILIASIVTKEMGRLLHKIDTIRKLDSLTKVFNHEQIEKQIAKEFSRCLRYRRNASLVMIDINNFKLINDTYGHQAGDKIILDLVELMQSLIRGGDIIGRYGGDEFIVILPETNLDSAQQFVHRLQKTIEDRVVIFENCRIKYSISAGVSAVNFEQSNYESWLRVTDKNLYKSKEKMLAS